MNVRGLHLMIPLPAEWLSPGMLEPGPRSSAEYIQLPSPFQAAFKEASVSAAKASDTASGAHTVQEGENLSVIVRERLEALGSTPTHRDVYEGVQRVTKANGLRNPDLIFPGDTLDLSVLGAVTRDTRTKTDASPSPLSKAQDSMAPASTPEPTKPAETPAMLAKAIRTPGSGALVQAAHRAYVEPQAAQGGPTHFHTARKTAKAVAEGNGKLTESVQRGLPPRRTRSIADLVRELLGPGASEAPRPESPWAKTLSGPARLSSEFGMRKDPFTGRPAFHQGIDLAAKSGTAVYPYRDGTVTFSGWKSGYGQAVIVDHGDGTESVYGHTSRNLVQVGEKVRADTSIAKVGSSGRSTGPHLHFEVRRNGRAVDPVPYLTREETKVAMR